MRAMIRDVCVIPLVLSFCLANPALADDEPGVGAAPKDAPGGSPGGDSVGADKVSNTQPNQ